MGFRIRTEGIKTHLSCLRDLADEAELPCDPRSWNDATVLGLNKAVNTAILSSIIFEHGYWRVQC